MSRYVRQLIRLLWCSIECFYCRYHLTGAEGRDQRIPGDIYKPVSFRYIKNYMYSTVPGLSGKCESSRTALDSFHTLAHLGESN